MKIHTIFLAFLLMAGCSAPEKGSLDTDVLARKVFDTLKSNDLEKYRLLIPGKEEFRRLYDLQKKDDAHFDADYQQMRADQSSQFTSFRSTYAEWEQSEYANTQDETVQTENGTESLVVTKIRSNGQVQKFTFKANKINGRWYVTGPVAGVSHG
jgi:hypothetical protein